MSRIKVTVSLENGDPICARAPKSDIFLTDASPLVIVKKDGGTVETISGNISTLLEFTARQMEGLGVESRRQLCEAFGLGFRMPG